MATVVTFSSSYKTHMPTPHQDVKRMDVCRQLHRSDKQGCPPQHVAVCAVAQPFTWTARSWPVMYIQDGKPPPLLIAYADDIMIPLTSTSDLPKIQPILHHYKWATGALINTIKSTALRLGLQDTALKCFTTRTRLKVRYLPSLFTQWLLQVAPTYCSPRYIPKQQIIGTSVVYNTSDSYKFSSLADYGT
jgi:hypothetical protein